MGQPSPSPEFVPPGLWLGFSIMVHSNQLRFVSSASESQLWYKWKFSLSKDGRTAHTEITATISFFSYDSSGKYIPFSFCTLFSTHPTYFLYIYHLHTYPFLRSHPSFTSFQWDERLYGFLVLLSKSSTILSPHSRFLYSYSSLWQIILHTTARPFQWDERLYGFLVFLSKSSTILSPHSSLQVSFFLFQPMINCNPYNRSSLLKVVSRPRQ